MADGIIPVNAFIISTKEEADQILLSRGKIIVLTEDIPQYLQSPQYGASCLMATCLLPDYEAVSHFVDGDMQGFHNIYMNMLASPECNIYFVSILSAIINNIPLGFIFGTEEIENKAMFEILQFFRATYGIALGTHYPLYPGWMDPNYVMQNEAVLYLNNLLTPQEFLMMYPEDGPIDQGVLMKLVYELNPPVKTGNGPPEHEYENYFRYCMKVLKQNNHVMIDPLVGA